MKEFQESLPSSSDFVYSFVSFHQNEWFCMDGYSASTSMPHVAEKLADLLGLLLPIFL
jgi:hypothetical protein